jgi:hypothetical protein
MQIEGVDPGGTTEPNGILEPGESNVSFAPTWFNASPGPLASQALTGALSNLSSDSSYTFTAPGGIASYGAIAAGGSGTCTTCYSLSFSFTGARPTPHVDVTVVETPSIAGAASDGSDARQWTIHVGSTFSDVAPSDIFYTFVEDLVHNGVTYGTGGGLYSPNAAIPRNQMVTFLARALATGDVNLPVFGTIAPADNPVVNGFYSCTDGGTSLYTDVAPTDPFCRQIHFVTGRNISAGCDGTPDFCPADIVTRRDMAILASRALVAPGGDAAVPNAATGTGAYASRVYDCTSGPAPFPDVPLDNPAGTDPACRNIGYIWTLGIVNGFGDGTYGPDLPTLRGQMAKFIASAFHLTTQKAATVKLDARLTGNSISVHSGSFTASGSGTFLLPSGKDAPTFGGATLRVFDTGAGSGAASFPGAGGAQIIPLPAAQWTLQSTASGPSFVYTGVANIDPCASVTIASAGQVTANCSVGITLQTPFSGDAALILDAGSSRFCATWQGTTKKNDATGLTRTDSPPPARCPAAQAAPQALQFTAPVFSNGLTVYPLFPLAGAIGPNVDALTITKVTQPLVRMPFHEGGISAGCHGLEPVPCTRQVGVVTIAPDGKSLVYDLNPGEPPQPVPTFPEVNREPLGAMCNLGTVDPDNLATTGTPANPSLFCVRGDEFAYLGTIFLGDVSSYDICSVPINYWPFPFQFTVSDGVTESTQTMILTMFDHTCIPLTGLAPALVILPPSPEDPQPNLAFGSTEDHSPTINLNTNFPPISLSVAGGVPGGSGGSFTVEATCPAIPNVLSPSCTGSASFAMDPGAPLLQSGNGATVQINNPLTVTSYQNVCQRCFTSVVLLEPPPKCRVEVCYLQSYAAMVWDVRGACFDHTQVQQLDCETGAVISGQAAPTPTR